MDKFTKHSYTKGSGNIAKDEDGVERFLEAENVRTSSEILSSSNVRSYT